MAEKTETNWVWWVVGIAALAFIVIWLFQSFSTEPSTPSTLSSATSTEQPGVPNTAGTSTGSGTPASGTPTITAIVQDPQSYDGMKVTTMGAVERVIGSRLLMVTESGAVGGQSVIVASPRAVTVVAGEEVSISGTVHIGVVRNVLNTVGIEVPSGTETLVGERAVIVADSIVRSSSTDTAPSAPTSPPQTMPPSTEAQ